MEFCPGSTWICSRCFNKNPLLAAVCLGGAATRKDHGMILEKIGRRLLSVLPVGMRVADLHAGHARDLARAAKEAVGESEDFRQWRQAVTRALGIEKESDVFTMVERFARILSKEGVPMVVGPSLSYLVNAAAGQLGVLNSEILSVVHDLRQALRMNEDVPREKVISAAVRAIESLPQGGEVLPGTEKRSDGAKVIDRNSSLSKFFGLPPIGDTIESEKGEERTVAAHLVYANELAFYCDHDPSSIYLLRDEDRTWTRNKSSAAAALERLRHRYAGLFADHQVLRERVGKVEGEHLRWASLLRQALNRPIGMPDQEVLSVAYTTLCGMKGTIERAEEAEKWARWARSAMLFMGYSGRDTETSQDRIRSSLFACLKVKRCQLVRDGLRLMLEDPETEEGYRSNVAMLLCDRWGIRGHEERNQAAREILALMCRDDYLDVQVEWDRRKRTQHQTDGKDPVEVAGQTEELIRLRSQISNIARIFLIDLKLDGESLPGESTLEKAGALLVRQAADITRLGREMVDWKDETTRWRRWGEKLIADAKLENRRGDLSDPNMRKILAAALVPHADDRGRIVEHARGLWQGKGSACR